MKIRMENRSVPVVAWADLREWAFVRAPLTKIIASLCLSIEVSLLPLQNPVAFQ